MSNTTKPSSRFYVAQDSLIQFLEKDAKQSFQKLASKAAISARTLVRMRTGGRVTNVVARKIHDAAIQSGLSDGFEKSFTEG